MSGIESKRLMKGAFLLALAGLLSKILSAAYRVPLQNLTGDIGFYVYQQVYPILGIAAVLGLYGFPAAVSKLAVDLKAGGYPLSFRSFYVPVLLLLGGFNSIISILLYINAGKLAVAVGDPMLSGIYQFSALIFLLLPFVAVLRGVFQGNYQMEPTAYSQVGEQLVRVCLIIGAAVTVALRDEVYHIGWAAVFASLLGTGAAILILSIFFVKRKPYTSGTAQVPWRFLTRNLLLVGVVAALNHMVLLVIQFADTFTLVPSLRQYGLSPEEAMEAKGVFDRGQPLIQLGTVLGSSFAIALVPGLSRHRLKEQPDSLRQPVRGALLFSFYLASGAVAGLITIFPEANTLLYQNDRGSGALQVLTVSILLCSLAVTGASLLQGVGGVKRTAAFIAAAFLVKWAGNVLLVPWWGIMGGALATITSLVLLCLLVYAQLMRAFPRLHFLKNVCWKPLFTALISMVIYLLFVEAIFSGYGMESRLSLLFYILAISTTGGALYLYILVRGHAFTKSQLEMLPFSAFFIRIHKGRKSNEQSY
ncbi:putative polysaccharide biosynthesis protein [Virgibacillus sediminis]|uniref:Oligosaccharide flippase family protein n=1 Tax=Virgibacillus sediminis TaxID=202260 RepID=A0ABV7A7J3_9BACI